MPGCSTGSAGRRQGESSSALLTPRTYRVRSAVPARQALDGYAPAVATGDDDREVVLADELVILPDQTVDDTDAGWGERPAPNDGRLLADRPPHWD